MSCTFDTNILVYTLGQPVDVKRQRAQSLIIRGARRQTAVLLLQSLTEFSYVATRSANYQALRPLTFDIRGLPQRVD